MAKQNYRYPPAPPVGSSTAFNNIVGFQLVNGGGLTQGNFQFTSASFEKVSRSFYVGVFSQPYTLETLKIDSIEQSKLLLILMVKVIACG